MEIRLIDQAQCRSRRQQLCRLLMDAVDSGASIGFLAPLELSEAEKYWDEVAASLHPEDRLLWVAEHEGEWVGTVQLDLPAKPNARYRAEVLKLMVRRDQRRAGVGRRLMQAVEGEARRCGRRLLVLDTRQGDDAERLYRKLGYELAGVIPEYALSSDGRLDGTSILYKRLSD